MKFVQLFILLSLGLLLSNCGDNPPDVNEGIIDPNFELVGTWYFQSVSGEGVISGVDTTDDDPNPTGYIIFRDDLTGFADFSLNLLDRAYSKEENFTYERTGERTLEVDKGDGDIEVWTIIRANTNIVEASWDIFISNQFNATITSIFTPNP